MQVDTFEAAAATTRRPMDSFAADVAEADWGYERAQIDRGITGGDLTDELGEVGDELLAAIRTGNHALVGRMCAAVLAAKVDRMTDREVGLDVRPTSAVEAVAKVLMLELAAKVSCDNLHLEERRDLVDELHLMAECRQEAIEAEAAHEGVAA